MVSKIVFLRPKQKEETIKNGQNQRVETLRAMFTDFGFSVQVIEVGRFPTFKEYTLVSNLLVSPNSALAITSFILLPWSITPLGIKRIILVDMMDSLKRTRKYSKENITRWVMGQFESLLSTLFRKNHIRTYISEYDRDSDKIITPKEISTFVIPNAISVHKHLEVSNLKRLVFVGDMNYSENRIILSKLCVVLDRSGMKLHIYGGGNSGMQDKFRNHVFHGTRDDVELYQPGDLHLAPIKNKHGLSSKVFHAIANGVPVLTTENGINGIRKCEGVFVENEIEIWPEIIGEIILQSQNAPPKVQWNGFNCDEREPLRLALIELLTIKQN
jgi:glycosyltransferase involved in cell wall biosynthesis